MSLTQKLTVATVSVILSFATIEVKSARAVSIIQDQQDFVAQIEALSPVGQTFTTEDASIKSIGFYVRDFNPQSAPNDFSVAIRLYEGVGTSGVLLGSGVFSQLFDQFSGYADVDFSSAVLRPGARYTAILSDDTSRWGLEGFDSTGLLLANAYLEGDAIIQGAIDPSSDLRFRVLANSTSVPEPSTVVGTIVFSGIGWLMKRK